MQRQPTSHRRLGSFNLCRPRWLAWLFLCLVLHGGSLFHFCVHGQEVEEEDASIKITPPRETQKAAKTEYHSRCIGHALFRNQTELKSPQETLQLLSETTCNRCQVKSAQQKKPNADKDKPIYHAMILLTEDVPQLIPLASALLGTGQFKLTVIRLMFDNPGPPGPNDTSANDGTFRSIHEQIMSGIRCSHYTRLNQESLTVMEASLDGATCKYPTSVHPLDACSLEPGPATANLLERLIRFSLRSDQEADPADITLGLAPDVIVADASVVGGLWISEAWRIPTVAIANHNFLPLLVEHDPLWNPPGASLLGRLWKVVQQRWYSLSITSNFRRLNFLRTTVNLQPLRSPVEYFKPVVAVLMDFAPPGSLPPDPWLEDAKDEFGNPSNSDSLDDPLQTRQWQNLHVLDGSLQAPCIPCDPTPAQTGSRMLSSRSSKKTNPTILVVAPMETTPEWTRSILQGVSLARESLSAYDDCEWLSTSCQKPYVSFEVTWLKPWKLKDDYFPPSVPSYIHHEPSLHVVDNVARHPETIAVLMVCDADSALLEQDLDFPVLCLSASDRLPLRPDQRPPPPLEPRILAGKLLHLLRKRQQSEDLAGTSSSGQTKGHAQDASSSFSGSSENRHSRGRESMLRAVQIVYRTAQVHRTRLKEGNWWESVDEMRDVLLDAVEVQLSEYDKNENHTVHFKRKQGKARYDSPNKAPYDNLTVLIAWMILLASSIYVFALDMAWVKPSRRNYHHVHASSYGYSSSSNAHSDGVLGRIEDLEDSWSLWLEWFRGRDFSFAGLLENIVDYPPTENGGGDRHTAASTAQHASTPHGRRRKKR